MKLATYDAGGGARTGVIVGETIIDVDVPSMIDLIAGWNDLRETIEAKAAQGGGIPLASVRLRPPVPRPGKIFAIGLNYADHVAESNMEMPKNQVWFTKAVTSINGPFDAVEIAANGPFVDYEVEMVAVIGRRGKNIAPARAAEHVFGYCVGNDVTERAWQHVTPQWSLGKSFDTHAPIGPWITTSDEVGDPHSLDIRCLVDGELRQNSNTKHLIFNVWDQIAYLSMAMTLEPGDLIFTGTPGGIGAAMDPRRFLKPGNVVRCEIDKLGAIESGLAAEAAADAS